jgi:hypothetical protein
LIWVLHRDPIHIVMVDLENIFTWCFVVYVRKGCLMH